MSWSLAVWTLIGLSAVGQSPTDPAKPGAKPAAQAPRQTKTLLEFRLIPIQEAKLSSTKPGMITELNVIDGAAVEKDDVMGQIDDRESQANIKHAKAELEVANKQASSDAPVQAAMFTHQVAEVEHKKAVLINETRANAVNEIEVDRLRLTMKKAEYQIEVARQEYDVAQLNIGVKAAQLEVAELEAELRKFRAPYACEVVQVVRHVGEWVREGEPVLHVVQMDKLRVQGYLSTKHIVPDSTSTLPNEPNAVDPSEIIGRECEVIVQLPKGRTETFKSKVGFVSPMSEVGDEIRVWVEIENKKVNGRWVAQPGQNANVKVLLDPPPKPKADPKAPAAKPAAGAPASNSAPSGETPKTPNDKSEPAKPGTSPTRT
jgi:multidrug efflux pump subunit AcrA (membrane-fusion protein)